MTENGITSALPAAQSFCSRALIPLTEKWGYIYGKSGQVWTAQDQKNASRETTVKYGAQWIGRRVCDCSGLVVWVAGGLNIPCYHGSNTLYLRYCSEKGKLKNGMRTDGRPLRRGSLLFLLENGIRHHVGIYMGDGCVIEARGTCWGVVETGADRFDEWGELTGVDYSREGECTLRPVLRRGSAGYGVMKLQRLLLQRGFAPGSEDGLFGEKTHSALCAFQRVFGLSQDGVAGSLTWERLLESSPLPASPQAQTREDLCRRLLVLLTEAKDLAEQAIQKGDYAQGNDRASME